MVPIESLPCPGAATPFSYFTPQSESCEGHINMNIDIIFPKDSKQVE